jgi:carbon storage regulator CsrA
MLVLTRKTEESISIRVGRDARFLVAAGEMEIVVTVLGINASSVRVGIDAPKTVEILRGELIEKGPDNAKNSATTETATPASDREAVTS